MAEPFGPEPQPEHLATTRSDPVEVELLPLEPIPVGRATTQALTPQQVEAVGLLLAGSSKSEAARSVGIGISTIKRWCKDHAGFRSALSCGLADLQSTVRPLILDGFRRGLNKLVELLEFTDGGVDLDGNALGQADGKVQLGAAVALTKIIRATEQSGVGILAGDSEAEDPLKEWRERYTTKRRVFSPHDIQLEAILCTTRYLVLVCGVQSGKTDTGAINFWDRIVREDNPDAVYWMVAPNTTIGKVMRKRFVSRAPAGWLPKPEGSGAEVNRTWILKNGATVEFRSAHTNRGENLVAETVSGAWLDEFTLMDEGVWRVSLSARLTTTGGWCIFTGTPRGKGWAYNDCWRRTLEHDDKHDPKWSGYTWPSSANPLISTAEEEEQKRNLPTAYYERERRASWETFHGQIYEHWSEKRMVLDLSATLTAHPVGAKVEAGMDWGFGKPGAMVVARETAGAIWEALAEWHIAKKLSAWWEAECIRAVEVYGVTTFWCDPAEPDRIASLRKALRKWARDNDRPCPKVRSARNEVKPGIRHVAGLFKQGRFRAHTACVVLASQLTSYAWKQDRRGDDTEEVDKQNDHLPDALRYLTWSSHNSRAADGEVTMGGAGGGHVDTVTSRGRARGRRRGRRR